MHDGPVSSVKIFTIEAKQYSISDELKGKINVIRIWSGCK